MIDILWISLIGASLVFLGLVVLWLLMDLLVRATSKKKKEKKKMPIVIPTTLRKRMIFDISKKQPLHLLRFRLLYSIRLSCRLV